MTQPGPPTPPLATGGMSPEGTTTVVRINRPNLPFDDKKVLCSAICKCKDTPGTGADGRSLRQSCVSGRLRTLDQVLRHRSPYKSEVNYDMTRQPPEPIMDSGVDTKPHDWLPGFIKKHWETDHGYPHLKGAGMVRRPDVVIVKDPTKPPRPRTTSSRWWRSSFRRTGWTIRKERRMNRSLVTPANCRRWDQMIVTAINLNLTHPKSP